MVERRGAWLRGMVVALDFWDEVSARWQLTSLSGKSKPSNRDSFPVSRNHRSACLPLMLAIAGKTVDIEGTGGERDSTTADPDPMVTPPPEAEAAYLDAEYQWRSCCRCATCSMPAPGSGVPRVQQRRQSPNQPRALRPGRPRVLIASRHQPIVASTEIPTIASNAAARPGRRRGLPTVRPISGVPEGWSRCSAAHSNPRSGLRTAANASPCRRTRRSWAGTCRSGSCDPLQFPDQRVESVTRSDGATEVPRSPRPSSTGPEGRSIVCAAATAARRTDAAGSDRTGR
jgi:hypothetical protein